MKLSAGALFFFEQKLLIVKPSYYDHWLLPGGGLDAGESPAEGMSRETREEIGLNKKFKQLLCAHYVAKGVTVGIQSQPRLTQVEEISFVFFGGNLIIEEVKKIQLDGEEIIEHKFLPIEEALTFLPNYHQERIPASIKMISIGGVAYLEGIPKTFQLT